jgi:anionic cell wall polymer biosynthesis LytR-Cps2A-Psr (LCP) family protein
VQTVVENFNIPLQYYLRVRFDAVLTIVDALGGVDLNLPDAMGGLEAGQHHLDGTQALAFIRDRKGTDDFFRMTQGQVMIKAMLRQMISPASWSRLPQVVGAVLASVDTNLPVWEWPRLGLAFLRAGLGGSIDNRTIQREMTTPTVTSGGASVLMPNWDLIHPYVQEMFR